MATTFTGWGGSWGNSWGNISVRVYYRTNSTFVRPVNVIGYVVKDISSDIYVIGLR